MKQLATLALVLLVGALLLTMVAALPPHGSADAPVHTGVSARFVEVGAAEAGSANLVTGILLNYRGTDTAGEVTVIFAAFVSVAAVLLSGGAVGVHRAREIPNPSQATEAPASPIVSFMVRLITPFIVLFAINVMLNGHITPGGGFQGGAILGALLIVLSITLGPTGTSRILGSAAGHWLRAAAIISFVLVGAAGAWFTGSFLGFPFATQPHLVGETMMVALDLGIGIGGAAIFGSIYLMLGTPDA